MLQFKHPSSKSINSLLLKSLSITTGHIGTLKLTSNSAATNYEFPASKTYNGETDGKIFNFQIRGYFKIHI